MGIFAKENNAYFDYSARDEIDEKLKIYVKSQLRWFVVNIFNLIKLHALQRSRTI